MSLRKSLLAFAARRPLLAIALTVGGVAAVASALGSGASPGAAGNPRLVLSRVWFDKLPEKRADVIQIWIFLAGGLGIYERGSSYQFSGELAEFERSGDKLHLTFLQDKKAIDTTFTVTACDEKPPFDLCLDFKDSPKGPKRLYGFGDEDDMARAVPWGKAMMRAAEGRAGLR